jgi:hypothetical protein
MCANQACVPFAAPASVGVITLDGLVVDITATPGSPTPYYTLDPEPPSDGLFAAGATITVDAAGSPTVAGFEATVSGVSDLAIDTIGLVELVDGQDFAFTWTPDGSEATVELVLQLGWHGLPPTGRIVCSAPDAAGTIVVSAELIAGFPYFSGIGLFQNPSWAERLTRTMVAGSRGPIEVRAASRVSLGVTHTAE